MDESNFFPMSAARQRCGAVSSHRELLWSDCASDRSARIAFAVTDGSAPE
jgi:hypothetical protein